MAGEELQKVRLKDDFYRDGFYKVIIALVTILGAIIFLIAISIYLYQSKPAPVYFSSDNEWRILAPVPVNVPYLKDADLLQWVSESIPDSINFDFINYPKQIKNASRYFTDNGWKAFTNSIINKYANEKTILDGKLFVSSNAAAAPTIPNRGIIDGRYAWWVSIPIVINYSNGNSVELMIQALVVRISTLDNLNGVAIENVIIGKGDASKPNG